MLAFFPVLCYDDSKKTDRGIVMQLKKMLAVCCAGICLAAMTACSKADNTASDETSDAETTASSAETTTTTAVVTSAEAETTADTETTTAAADETGAAETTTTGSTADTGETKLLWSERGLEAVPADSEDGYGAPLEAGTEYLNWTLDRYSGTVSGSSVSSLDADFTYNGSLSTNGILTVLASSDADNPNGLYLRVDNQADFPYFPADTRERGYFIIENAEDVYEWLELDEPPVSSSYTIAVTVDVVSLHVSYTQGGYDTIVVTSASKR